MSSFTIDKKDYMKCAGLVAGMAKELNIWLYDYETRRNSNEDDYKRRFTECYEMNALSVNEQYRGEDVGAKSGDTKSYDKEFKTYYKIGQQIVWTRENIQKTVMEIEIFLSSSIYQTEKEPYMFKMQMFYDRLLVELFKATSNISNDDLKSWGSFEIEAPKSKVVPLF